MTEFLIREALFERLEVVNSVSTRRAEMQAVGLGQPAPSGGSVQITSREDLERLGGGGG